MSPSVMTLPARNFKFLTRDHLKEQEIIDVEEKIAIDREGEIGVQVLIRGARGVELMAAGRAFLDHARLARVQAYAMETIERA
jgi:hypothetical protein